MQKNWPVKFNFDVFLQIVPLDVFLAKGVLKICSKFTGEHTCRKAISIKSQSNFIEIAFQQLY